MKITYSAAMALLDGNLPNDGHAFGHRAIYVKRTVSDAQRLEIGKWSRSSLLSCNVAKLKSLVARAEEAACLQMRCSPWGVVTITADKSETISGMAETLQLEGRDFEWSLS